MCWLVCRWRRVEDHGQITHLDRRGSALYSGRVCATCCNPSIRSQAFGEATSGQEAIQLARQLQPDIVLMDLQMPGLNGIEATRQIVYTSPHISILMLTMFEDDESVFAALRAGARGYLLKGTLKAEIVRAIQGVASGEAIFGPSIARRLMQYFSAPRPTAPPQLSPNSPNANVRSSI